MPDRKAEIQGEPGYNSIIRDANNRITEYRYYSDETNYSQTRYFYPDANTVRLENYEEDQSLQYSTVTKRSGATAEMIYYDKDGKPQSKTTYTLNANGKATEAQRYEYDANGSAILAGKDEYKWEGGNQVEQKNFNTNGSVSSSATSTFDDKINPFPMVENEFLNSKNNHTGITWLFISQNFTDTLKISNTYTYDQSGYPLPEPPMWAWTIRRISTRISVNSQTQNRSYLSFAIFRAVQSIDTFGNTESQSVQPEVFCLWCNSALSPFIN